MIDNAELLEVASRHNVESRHNFKFQTLTTWSYQGFNLISICSYFTDLNSKDSGEVFHLSKLHRIKETLNVDHVDYQSVRARNYC